MQGVQGIEASRGRRAPSALPMAEWGHVGTHWVRAAVHGVHRTGGREASSRGRRALSERCRWLTTRPQGAWIGGGRACRENW